MLFYEKQPLSANRKRKLVSFSKFSTAKDGKDPHTLYGCKANSLRSENGFAENAFCLDFFPVTGSTPLPSMGITRGIAKFYYYSYKSGASVHDEFMYLDKLGYLYKFFDGSFSFSGKSFNAVPKTVQVTDKTGNNFFVFVGEKVQMLNRDGTFMTIWNRSVPTGACEAFDRLFFTEDDFTVRFSYPLYYTVVNDDADDGGSVSFSQEDGKITGMTVLDGALYVLREHALEKMSVKGSSNDFTSESVDYGFGKSYKNTFCKAENCAMFLSESGLIRLSADKLEKVITPFALPKENAVTEAFFHNGIYILNYTENGSDKVVAIVAETGEFFELGTSRVYLANGNLFCVQDGKVYTLKPLFSGENVVRGNAVWESTDFGVEGRKLLRSLVLDGEGECRIVVKNKTEAHRYLVSLDGGAKVCPLLYGEKFALTVSPVGTGKVRSVKADFYVNA